MTTAEDPDDIMTPLFKIKAVVNQTGLKPHTIRAWERRYGFPQPKRTDGGHRQYTQRDIDTLKWLITRQQAGLSISHAIDLWRSKIEEGEDPFLAQNEIAGLQSRVLVLGRQGKHFDDIWEE